MAKKIEISTTEYEALLNIETASRAIFDAQRLRKCTHGIGTTYPLHLWYCDDCWEYLQKNLMAYDELEEDNNG